MSDDDRIVGAIICAMNGKLLSLRPGADLTPLAQRILDGLRGKGIVVEGRDALCERISDAVEWAVLNHEPRDNDSHCSCGVRNNMDGDVLHAHRMTEIDAAIWAVS